MPTPTASSRARISDGYGVRGRTHDHRFAVGRAAALLRGAESIAYTGEGTGGRTCLDAMARLGLAEAVAPKGRPMGAGGPVAAVAAGETELAVGPLTTMMASPGMDPAAIFPAAAGAQIDISVFLSTLRAAGAAEVPDVLTGPELDAELAAAGVVRFEPCR